MRLLVLSLIALLVLGGAGAFWLRSAGGEAEGGEPAEAPGYERVVLVTIDTLRADHLSCYGYRRETSPFLDSLAERGVLFERAVSAVSNTAPSHATMLTGVPPAVHGVFQNGQRVAPSTVDLPLVFASAGYETAAFLNVKFLSGIARSFGHVDVQQYKGGPVADAAIEWLRGGRETDRFFVWVHLFDPHHWKADASTPAAELEAIRAMGPADADGVEAFYDYLAELHGLPEQRPGEPFHLPLTDGRKLRISSRREYIDYVDNYDAQILYADSSVERIFEAVDELGLLDGTLFVVTSDHGEGLGSHGIVGHGSRIYQEQVHVPLIVAGGGGGAAGRRVPDLVQHLDLFPTLVRVAGGDTAVLQDPELFGVSLLPFLSPDPTPAAATRPAFSQRRRVEQEVVEFDPRGRGPRTRELGEGAGEIYALQTLEHKYLLHAEGEDEFYDLRSDPKESVNLVDSDLAEEEALRRRLEGLVRAYAERADGSASSEVGEEWMDELRALGYVR